MNIVSPFKNLPEVKREAYNHDFVPYVIIEELFNAEEVEKIRNLWKEDDSFYGKLGSADTKKEDFTKRKSRIMPVDEEDNSWIYTKLGMTCIMLNFQKFKFDILGFHSKLQLTDYSKDGFFAWHMDTGNKFNSTRKLSITVQLSDPDEYEGGDLQFHSGNDIVTASKKKGTAIIFPSFVYHRVQPVTSGKRMSVVGWIAGPPFR